MNKRQKKYVIVLGVLLLLFLATWGAYRWYQSYVVEREVITILKQRRSNLEGLGSEPIASSDLLHNYYHTFPFQPIWTAPDTAPIHYRKILQEMLHYADSLGLDTAAYHNVFFGSYDSLQKMLKFDEGTTQTAWELLFSDACMSFLYDAAYGDDVLFQYDGIAYKIDSALLLNAYHAIVATGQWREIVAGLEPKSIDYRQLKTEWNRMKSFLRSHPNLDTTTVNDSQSGHVIALEKLRFYGVATAADTVLSATMLAMFQKKADLDPSGKLDKQTLEALNRPLQKQMELVRKSLNAWRWCNRIDDSEFVVVNIPAALLKVVRRDSAAVLTMRVIVGKKATPTPSFTGYMTKVIAYPYWNVPNSIAVKEMLPKIKRNPNYLQEQALQVLDKQGKPVNPEKISWAALSAKNFPYRIRQSTGCDNSLGVLKFDLSSPFSIYLHDTNAPSLFERTNRFLSHGCIRLERPMQLADYVMENGLDTATATKLRQCLKTEQPTSFNLRKKFPVVILYLPAAVDSKGQVVFYPDVYAKETF